MAIDINLNLNRNELTGLLQSGYDPEAPVYAYGDTVVYTGGADVGDVTRAFAKPYVNSTSLGGLPANAGNFIFDDPQGYQFTVVSDSVRGKVLKNTQDNSHYNSIIWYSPASPIPENQYLYFSYSQKIKMLKDGINYTDDHYCQLKNWRWNYLASQADNTVCDVKLHSEINNLGVDQDLFIMNNNGASNSLANPQPPYYFGDTCPPLDNTWFTQEGFIFTGTQDGQDGYVAMRLVKNGVTQITKYVKNLNLYGSANRYQHFLMQAYGGNFGTTPDEGTKPDSIEVWNDSPVIIHGQKRFDIANAPTTQGAKIRQNCNYTISGSDAIVTVDPTGWPSGYHNVKLRKIIGIDANGWDIVESYQNINIFVS